MKLSIQEALKLFRSTRFTAWIIGSLVLVYFIGLILPHKRMFASRQQYEAWISDNVFYQVLDSLQLTDIFISPVTLTLLGLFFINLTVVIIGKTPTVLKKAYVGTGPQLTNFDPKRQAALFLKTTARPEIALQTALQTVKGQGFNVLEKDQAAFIALKNRFSPLGFLLFHASFLLCLIGSLMIFYTRFSGRLALTEGEAFTGNIAQFRSITRNSPLLKRLPQFGIVLDKVQYEYAEGVPSELQAGVRILFEGTESRRSVGVNRPVTIGPMSVLVASFGISPLFEVLGPSGEVLDAVFVSLNVLEGREDSFQLADDRYTCAVRFYPDFVLVNGKAGTRSEEIRNPAFSLQITENGNEKFGGIIRMGEEATFDTFRIRAADIRFWVDFNIVREYGKFPLMTGFVLAAIGLIMRLVFFQKRIIVFVEESAEERTLYLYGSSEFFPHTFKEDVRDLFHKISERIGKI